MRLSYFFAYLRANIIKTLILIVAVALFFASTVVFRTAGEAIPAISRIPLRTIGVNTLVQREGVIPDKIEGIVFPHASGPIYPGEYRRLKRLGFVRGAEPALYFWDFDGGYKSVLGIEPKGPILSGQLKRDILSGHFNLGDNQVIAAYDYLKKHHLAVGDSVDIHNRSFIIAAGLKPSAGAQVLPADLYLKSSVARRMAGAAPEIKRNYHPRSDNFYNVILLQTDPDYPSAKKIAAIKTVNAKFLIYSEQTFSRQIMDNLKLLSATGRFFLGAIGLLVIAGFIGLVAYSLKTRESDIAILRALGWKVGDIRKQFISEFGIVLITALVIGNLLSLYFISAMGNLSISLEVPWEISAKPHFLVSENAIQRVIKAKLPVSISPAFNLELSLLFAFIFIIISWLMLNRVKKIKALDVMLR